MGIPNVIQTPAKKILMGGQVTPNSRPTSERKRKRGTGHSTGYIIFAAHAHPKVRAENPGLQFGEISRLVGEEWRGLDDKTKKEYEEKTKEQTARAEAEGRLVPKRKKKKKHDDSIIIDDSSVTSTENSRQGALTPSNFPLPPQPMHGQQLVAPVNQMCLCASQGTTCTIIHAKKQKCTRRTNILSRWLKMKYAILKGILSLD